ncbi:unnamed protein product [Gongylonema pulchrum]|uniref:PKS_ER domain-containing protein n=1 Tax=Gongylonema pulchrum TaxID=637853 RepID=A0A183CV10_9BILA|nr:unnamed protein product [Gongylonema pulchrum]
MQRSVGVLGAGNILMKGCRMLRAMSTWITARFGEEMEKSILPVPIITKPNQLLLQVKAASVNPIDTAMRNGYGNQISIAMRQLRNCSLKPMPAVLPFIGGRDCSGVVEQTGGNVNRFRKGDEIARIKPSNAPSQRVLIHGGAGGVGTTAIQMLRAWNVQKVVATCSEDCFHTIRQLGAVPINYKSPLALEQLIAEGPFDVILDCADSELAQWSDKVMGLWRNCVHPAVQRGQWFTYAYFAPSSQCMEQISDHLRTGKIKPVIDEIFNYDQLPAAYEKVQKKKGRGKTVIDFGDVSNESRKNHEDGTANYVSKYYQQKTEIPTTPATPRS